MGLESYLFQIIFQTPTSENGVIAYFTEAGMVYLNDISRLQTENSYGNLFFELRTLNGLTEVNVVTSPGDTTVDEFSLRFSILSPNTVVDQTFGFLQRLNKLSRIEVYDTEIRNHIMRHLWQTGKVDQNFEGLNADDDEAIDKLCSISLDTKDFIRNELEINKRQRVLDNTEGEIIEGGSATINFIEEKGLFDRFFGWIKKNSKIDHR